MPKKITYEVGVVGHDSYVEGVAGARQEITVEVHELEAEVWGVDKALRYVGAEIPRVDGPAKATGAAKYTYDVNRPDLAYAGMVTSPHAHAKVTAIDASKAKAMKGVLSVQTFDGKRVTYAGSIVAAVCAESEGVLADAIRAIDVSYDVLPVAAVTEDAMKDEAPLVDPRRRTNVRSPRRGGMKRGDPDKVFAQADVTVEAEFRSGIQTHSCLEPHGCTVEIGADGNATVWASTQATARFANGRFLQAIGTPRNRVRVITEHMGGGFGSKFGPQEWDVICAAFAKETGRPVRHLLTRREEHLLGGNRPDCIQKIGMAGTKDGKILGLRGETWGTSGNGGGGAGSANTGAYDLGAVAMKQNGVSTFSMWGRAFRAPRHPQGFFALEGILERYAAKVGMDPLALRIKNDPHPIRQVQWKIGADRMQWAERRRKVPGSDPGAVKRGVGCAASRWNNGGRGSYAVDMIVEADGGVVVRNCVQDLGTGIRTVMSILAAEELGVDLAKVSVEIGDSRLPPGPGSGGSTTTPSLGPAVRDAGMRAKESLAGLLALEWGVDEGDVEWKDGVFHGPGGKKAPFAKACGLIGKDGLRVQGRRRPNWNSPFAGTAGCQFAQVAVDTETGIVTVEKVVAVHDSGRIIDAMTARSQVNGGVIQGISYALYEEKQLDRNLGDMVNPTFDTYRIMGIKDCPEIDVVLTSVVSGYNNAGIMGLGEPATVPTAAAVANAVYNAIGVQVLELPMTPARVLAALEGRQG